MSQHTPLSTLPAGRCGTIVRIDAGIDPATGIIRWTFTSIDPDTGEAPIDALLGFLPPDDGVSDSISEEAEGADFDDEDEEA